MISCTEFIYCYNLLFSFLDERHGYDVIKELWAGISDGFLENLDALIKEKGTFGMKEYWSRTLVEEDAVFEMKADENSFEVFMRECPSVKRAQSGPVPYYPHYCDHCPALYVPLIEKYGFEAEYEIIDREKGICRFAAYVPGTKQPPANESEE